MFTVIPRSGVKDHGDQTPVSGEPVPQIIDHREQGKTRGKGLNWRKNDHQQTYESIKEERDDLIQLEFKYKKKIKELEQEKEDLLKVYEPTYNENERLKGHLLHGPDAQKIKKLKQEKREVLGELEIVKQENVELTDRVKELEKMFVSERDYYREKKWREAIERGRKRREEKDAGVSTQGPFASTRKPSKRDLKTVKDEEFEKQDVYDLHIDSLEKETQIILNKIRHLKQNKESIDYANFIGKGAITRNAAVANAINEKLERDLISFEERLENLRKKTKKINSDTTEEAIVPEKKLKTKQVGTRYFRTRPTQTDPLAEETRVENKSKDINENKEQNFSNGKPVVRSENASRKEHKKRVTLTIVSTSKDDGLFEASDYHADQQLNKSIGYTSPIAEHWANLATKLNETAKYATKKSPTHRDKVSRFKADLQTTTRSGSYKRHKQSLGEDEYQESDKIETNSAKSQSSTASISSQSSLKISSQNRYELYRNYFEEKSNRDVELKADDISKSENDTKNTDTIYKTSTSRKTTNMGEVIRYIPRQHSWEMIGRVNYTGDQMGRYSNGPEPISRYRKPEKRVNTSKELLENKNNEVNWQSTLKKLPEKGRESRVSRDSKPRQRAAPSEDEILVTRNTSAYDEVLADVRKQYKDQVQKKKYESKVHHNREELQSDVRAGNDSKQSGSIGGIKRQNTYNLDLL